MRTVYVVDSTNPQLHVFSLAPSSPPPAPKSPRVLSEGESATAASLVPGHPPADVHPLPPLVEQSHCTCGVPSEGTQLLVDGGVPASADANAEDVGGGDEGGAMREQLRSLRGHLESTREQLARMRGEDG